MISFYAIHVFGKWALENYRRNEDTTAELLLHNSCLILEQAHTLRPNNGVPDIGEGIKGEKLAGSCMNFADGHITGMILLSFLLAGILLFVRKTLVI